MGQENRFNMITDEAVRSYVEDNIKEMTGEVALTLRALRNQPQGRRANVRVAGELYSSSMMVEPLVRGFDAASFKSKVKKAVWETFCNVKSEDNTKGEPDKRFKRIFDSDGIGTKIIEVALIAGFAALAKAWAALGALLITDIGKKIKEWVIGLVTNFLDEMVEKRLEGYCSLVPTE